MIFQFVFESCIGSEDRVDGNSLALWLDEDPLSPYLFPYTLACVCLRWFLILRTIPVYWTRLVITVDAIVKSLDTARITLKWAGDCPLKVIIVTQRRGTSETDDSERKSVGCAISHICFAFVGRGGYFRNTRTLEGEWMCPTSQGAHAQESLRRWPHLRSSKLRTGNSHEYEGKLEVPLLEQVTFSDHFLKNPPASRAGSDT